MNAPFQQDNASIDALPRLAKNGVLVLEFTSGPDANFRVKQASDRIQELIKGLPEPLIGATTDQLPIPLNAPGLTQQLQQALSHGPIPPFQLRPPLASAGLFPAYACQLLKIDDHQLILSLDRVDEEPAEGRLLEQMLERMPVGLIQFRAIRNADGEIVDFQAIRCNQLGARISRQIRQDILSRPISERYPAMQATELFHHYVAVVKSGRPHHQLQYLAPQDIWLDVSVVSYEDGLLVSFQDVTLGQKTASLLEHVMNSSPAAVRYYESIRDPAGLIVDFMTSTGNELVAYRPYRPAESTTGRRMLELYPDLKTNGLFERYKTVVESGESDHFETTQQLGENPVWFDCTVVRHGDGFVLTTLDITAQKLAQLEQERQTELVNGVLNSSACSVLVLNPLRDDAGQIIDFQISLANPATSVLFSPFVGRHVDPEEVVVNTMLTLFPASNEREIFKALIVVVSNRQPIHHQVDYPSLSIAYDYDLTPFRDGVLMITTDITPLRAYQKKLEENNAALRRSNEYLQQFASVASHDLQEPLRKVRSLGDLLATTYAGELGPAGADLIQRMQRAASRMDNLIRDLLAYSRLSTYEQVFAPQDLNGLVADVLSDLEITIQQTNASIDVASLPTIQGDALQLRQLFQNLLSNAFKFTRPAVVPVVTITSAQVRGSQVEGLPAGTGRQLFHQISVIDNGIGFDPQFVEKIFIMFQRLHGRNQYSGTGIGLAICKKIVDNHRGYILAQSQPEQGSAFRLYFPVDGVKPAPPYITG